MEVVLHNFPIIDDGVSRVEEFYCQLLNQYRNGEDLDDETLDWLDQANTWLMAI